MNATSEAVLALLKTALFNQPLTLPADVDWEAVYREMQLHTVLALVGDILPEDMDQAVAAKWQKRIAQNVQRFYHVLHEQQETLAVLQQGGYKTVVLKGVAAAQYYPEPAYRAMGDIDLLLQKETADKVQRWMLEHGYRRIHADDKNPRHYTMMKNGVVYEMHRFFSVLTDEKKASYFDSQLFAALENPCIGEYDGYHYATLPDLQNGLVILEHVNHHMASGIGLRQILDWLVYADRVLDDEYWESVFQPIVEKLGLERFAMTITRMGQLYFGLRTDKHLWCAQADEQICQAMLAFVLDNGNFGVKHGEQKAAAKVLTDYASVWGMFCSLQRLGCENYMDLIGKYPFLRPFAWLMRIYRLASLAIRQKLSPASVLSSYKESRRRIALFKDLGVLDSKKEHD